MANTTLPKWKRALIIVIAILFAIGIVISSMCIAVAAFRKRYFTDIPDHVTLTNVGEVQPLQAVGRGIYDKNGDRVALNGINFGNWLLQEGWMSVNSLGPSYKKNGDYLKINDQGIVEEYDETYQEEVFQAMYNNPNLTAEQIDALWDVYYDNYITEVDFINVKSIGMNTIRLPMYYRNFMEGDDDNLTMRADAFERLDWFLEMCRKHDLYAILDMHGVVGGQSGYEHSGTRSIDFWNNETYIAEMCTLWENIALHYKNERPDLSETIAAYDIVNEPVNRNTPNTTHKQWKVLDRLYQAVRKVDTTHIISIECCWFYYAFPKPERFGWDNVMYQIHLYNWSNGTVSNDFYYWLEDLTYAAHDYDVPYLIGEFNFFDNESEWLKWLDEYDRRGYNWTIWNYKMSSVGWWDNSWGVYVNRMNLQNEKLKLDLRTATYDEIYAEWSTLATDSTERKYETGVLYNVLTKHFAKQ